MNMNGNDSYWQGRKILITGINGFVGGNLAKALHTRGADIVGLIRNIRKDSYLYYEGLADNITIIHGDVTDRELLRKTIVEEQITCCFHLAAQVEVGIARSYPFLTWETNIRGTYALLEAIRESDGIVQAVIFASTDKAYGSYDQQKLPYLEEYPLIPVYPYDVSKACADMIARSYASDIYCLPIIIARCCNIYGPGQLNFSALIPDAIRSAWGYGRFTPRGNGLHIRDYIYVDDVVRLYIMFAERLFKDHTLRGEVFNAGTNQPKKVKEIVRMIYQILGREDNYQRIEELWEHSQTTGEIDIQYMDYEKVNNFFGWKPCVDFDTGLRETIRWFERYLKRQA